MAEKTRIEWCHHTFNPWIGCQHATYTDAYGKIKAHLGCLRCYAEADMEHRRHRVKWGPHGTRSRTSDAYWKQPLRWDWAAAKAGKRRRVFCASLADVFEDWQGLIRNAQGEVILTSYLGDARDTYDDSLCSWEEYSDKQGWKLLTMADLRRDLFALIDRTPNLDWLLLTKRPENVRRMWPAEMGVPDFPGNTIDSDGQTYSFYRPNVWLGTSISDQPTADALVPQLLGCRDLCPVLFLSAEPLLGSIVLHKYFSYCQCGHGHGFTACPNTGGVAPACHVPGCGCTKLRPWLRWVIPGGESGPNARPCNVEWIRSLVQQCRAAGVSAFFKQTGSRPYETEVSAWPNGYPHGDGSVKLVGDGFGKYYVRGLKDRKGGDPAEWSEDLRVREFPTVEVSRP